MLTVVCRLSTTCALDTFWGTMSFFGEWNLLFSKSTKSFNVFFLPRKVKSSYLQIERNIDERVGEKSRKKSFIIWS